MGEIRFVYYCLIYFLMLHKILITVLNSKNHDVHSVYFCPNEGFFFFFIKKCNSSFNISSHLHRSKIKLLFFITLVSTLLISLYALYFILKIVISLRKSESNIFRCSTSVIELSIIKILVFGLN